MKIIQAIVALFAIIGCLALALGGYFLYDASQNGGENFLTRFKNQHAEATTATQTAKATPAPSGEYAGVLNDYAPAPTPAPVAAAPGAVAAPGTVVAAAPGMVVATPIPAPAIKTPGSAVSVGKIRNWASGKKWVALTYDDGPHSEWTPKMIELLRSKNTKATFFLLGNMIEKHPDIVQSLVNNGFEIANHTFSHPNFNTKSMTIEKIKAELTRTNTLLAPFAPQGIKLMRPPFGNTGPDKLEPVCDELGLNIVCWDIDTDDWRKEVSAEKMAENVMKNLKDGSIILMHDKHQKTYDCTALIIDQVRAKGYEFVTVGELLGHSQALPTGIPVANPAATAPVGAAPVGAAPAGIVAPATGTALPVPAAAAPAGIAPAGVAPAGVAAPAGTGLPAPAAATAPAGNALPVPAVNPGTEGLDASKITRPPTR